MFHPVGSQPPSVYWRRRFILVALLVLLVVLAALTANALSGSNDTASAHSTSAPSSSPSAGPTTPTASSSSTSSAAHSSASASGHSSATTATPVTCAAKSLDVTAAVGRTTYKVGTDPLLQLQVTNIGAQPCVQDLADKDVELRVYNGESRVWGSHDCKVQSGTMERTLAPNVAVKVAISWTGLSSQAGCKGTRQRVGAGSYTLYALLDGRMAKAAQFSIS
jgi:hypothetical protein